MKIISILLAFLLTIPIISAQELDVTVNVRTEILSASLREYVADFQSQIQKYMNEHRWTEFDFRGDKIPVTMEINFTSGSDAKDFTAQIVIVSQRRIFEDDRPTDRTSILLRVNDARWSFTYIQGMPLYHNEFQFHQIASVLDFYAYLIIGLDFDSYEPLQGTSYYQKALVVAQRAQGSSSAGEWSGDLGKYSRGNLLSDLMNAQFDPFRNSLYLYFYEGLDYLKTEHSEAQKNIARALNDISELIMRTNARSILLTMFFEAKGGEFCALLDGYSNRPAVMRSLAQADPQRSSMYMQCNF